MGAPKGNEFWKKRSKHGREKIFKTPDILLEACYEYFEYQGQQVWNKTDYRGKDILRVEIPTASPFTLTGLCIFLGVNTQYFTDFTESLDLSTEKGKDFSLVIKHVREVIYTQKLEGAAVGAYNANIIARELGLADKKEVEKTESSKLTIIDETITITKEDKTSDPIV